MWWAVKDCPGDGCQNKIYPNQELCTACSIRSSAEAARLAAEFRSAWLADMVRLERLLERHAEFDAWLAEHEAA